MLNSNCIELIDSFYLDIKILFIYFMFYVNLNLIFLWISVYYRYNHNLYIENYEGVVNNVETNLKSKDTVGKVSTQNVELSNQDLKFSEIDEDWCMEM